MSGNKSFDLISLMLYLTRFQEDATFNQDFVVCMADRSISIEKSSKLPKSKLPTYKPEARSDIPDDRSRLPRKSAASRLPTAESSSHQPKSTVPISSSKIPSKVSSAKPVERVADRTRRPSKLSAPKDTSTSIPTSSKTIASTSELPEKQNLEEIGKIYMSMSMYLNSDSLRKTLVDQVSDRFETPPSEETITKTGKKGPKSPKLTDQKTKEKLDNADSINITRAKSPPSILSAPYDIEKQKDKWYEDYMRKRQATTRVPSSLSPIQETDDDSSIVHNSPRKLQHPSSKQTNSKPTSARAPNFSTIQYHIDKLSKYVGNNSQRRNLVDQINNIFYSSTPAEGTTTTGNEESPTSQSKLSDQITKKDIASIPPIISAPYDIEKQRENWYEDHKRKREAARKQPSSLQPILEETHEASFDQEFESEEKQVENALEFEEKLLLKKIENELPSGLIYDTNMSILVSSSSSSIESFETELVIKAPSMRKVTPVDDAPDHPDLSISQQAILESKRLTEQIEAMKNKYYISVAKKKYDRSREPEIKKQKITAKIASSRQAASSQAASSETPSGQAASSQARNGQAASSQAPSSEHAPTRNPFHDALEKKLRDDESSSVSRTAHSPEKSSISVDLMDTHLWGAAALPDPIPPHRDDSGSSSDLDILTDKDMNTDGIFGDESTTKLDTSSQRRRQQEITSTTDPIEDVNDFEDPQFDDLPSDESVHESLHQPEIMSLDVTEKITDLEDPQFDDLPLDDSIHHISDQPDIEPDTVPQSPAAASKRQTDPLEDMKRIKEFIMSGRQFKDVTDQNTIDLFMRCSESLINPVVRIEVLERQSETDELIPVIHEIPLSSFTHGKSYEKGLLDESINQNDLEEPLIKEPLKKKLNYFADFDALEDPRFAEIDLSVGEDDEDDEDDEDARYTLIFGLPKFTYEPVPQYLYRRKVHDIMDSEEEPEDSDEILEDADMDIDSLVKETAEPTYKFQSEPNFIEQSRAREKHYRNLIEKLGAERQPELPDTTVPESEHLDDPVRVSKPQELKKPTNQEILKRIFVQSCINVNEMVDGYSVESILIPYFFDYPIIREVDNCPYHMKIVNLVYKNYEICYGPASEVGSPTEMHDKFYRILTGRICARLETCPPQLSTHPPKSSSVTLQSDDAKVSATTTSSAIDPRPTRAVIKKYFKKKVAEDGAAEALEIERRKTIEAEENAKRKVAEEMREKEASLNLPFTRTEEQDWVLTIENEGTEKPPVKIKKLVSWADDEATTTKSKTQPTSKTKTSTGKNVSGKARSATTSTTGKASSASTSGPEKIRADGASSEQGSAGTICKKTVIITTTTRTTTSNPANRDKTLTTKRK